jgi:hypothetical protein
VASAVVSNLVGHSTRERFCHSREYPQLRSLTFLGRKKKEGKDITGMGNIDHTALYATKDGSTIGQ